MNRAGRGAVAAPTLLVGVLAGLALAACDGAAPTSRAQRIASSDQLIGGPKAIGRIGDYLLENDKIRVIVHDKGPGRVATLYGGSIVDADIVRPGGGGGTSGNDQLAELVPAWLFEVMNPTSVEVTADGADGGPAEITVRGTGDDLLQMVALLDAGLLFPPSLSFTQVYRLAPGASYVEIESTITNTTAGLHPLPYLDPAELQDLGFDVPLPEGLELSVPFGHFILLGGEQAMFAPGKPGFDIRFGIEGSYPLAPGFPAFPGLVVDHIATHGQGVSYGFAVPAGPSNYVNAFKDLYEQRQTVTPESLLLIFNYASVAGAYTANPPPLLAAGESFTYTSYFVVGRGDVASVSDVVHDLRGDVTGTFAGKVLDARDSTPALDVSVVILAATGDDIVGQAAPDTGGAFRAKLTPGDYRYLVVGDDRERGEPVPFTVRAGEITSKRIYPPPPATLDLLVLDDTGRPAPAKISVVAEYEGDHAGEEAREFLYSFALGERKRATRFEPPSPEFVEKVVYTVGGRATTKLRPGSYTLVVSRGPEFEVTRVPVELAAGETTAADVRLVRAFEPDGWIAGDFHLHAAPSTDSEMPLDQRVLSCAGEGLDLAVATDHNSLSDYAPHIAATGLHDWLSSMIGTELTTFEMGHFNGYPLAIDPGSTRGGEYVWTRQPPDSLFGQLRDLGRDRDDVIVQVNHPRTQVLGYFAQFFVDSETAETYLPSGLRGVFAPYGDEFGADQFSYDFDAVELLSAKLMHEVHTLRYPDPVPDGLPDPQPAPGDIVRGPDGRPAFPGAVETWFAMLDRGLRPTGMGTSDSHGLASEPGFARTMLRVGADKDSVGRFSERDVTDAIRAHRAVATNGPLLELTIGEAGIGDDVRGGPTVDVHVRVRAPAWAPVEHLTLFSNGGVPLIDEAIPATDGTDFQQTYTVALTEDAWIVGEVRGSANMFPVVTPAEFEPLDPNVVIKALASGFDLSALTGATQPDRTYFITPLAITNPIWVDVDGGGWTPPRPPLTRRSKPHESAPLPDVRAAFDAIPALDEGPR